METLALRPGEGIFGLGEQFLRLNKVGQTVDLNMVEATGTTTPRAYKNIPFFVSTAGYGLFLNHSSRITLWVGSMGAVDVQVAAEDDLDYFIFLGDIKPVLGRYTDLTGTRHRTDPIWPMAWLRYRQHCRRGGWLAPLRELGRFSRGAGIRRSGVRSRPRQHLRSRGAGWPRAFRPGAGMVMP